MRLKKNNFDLQFALLCFVRYSTLKKINQDVHYRMTEKLQSYYLSKVEPFRSCLLALREIILDHNPVITETQKYFMPCFCYKKKIICYLWTDRKTDEPYILVADGKLFDMPELEQGKRSRMKIFRVDPEKDLPLEMIRLILNKALENLSKEQKNK